MATITTTLSDISGATDGVKSRKITIPGEGKSAGTTYELDMTDSEWSAFLALVTDRNPEPLRAVFAPAPAPAESKTGNRRNRNRSGSGSAPRTAGKIDAAGYREWRKASGHTPAAVKEWARANGHGAMVPTGAGILSGEIEELFGKAHGHYIDRADGGHGDGDGGQGDGGQGDGGQGDTAHAESAA